MSAKKSEHNPCPVCGLPRGKGDYEFAHGKCIEIRAQTDGKKSAGLPGSLSRLTVDNVKKAKAKRKRLTQAQFDKWLVKALAWNPSYYDFDAEHELVEQCKHDEYIHMDCEQRSPPEIDYAD